MEAVYSWAWKLSQCFCSSPLFCISITLPCSECKKRFHNAVTPC